MERVEIVRDLRMGVFDVLVGINLLREGLDIPEITLVAILDADKEGFLRSETSLIQTIGRAARNSEGHVIMYADMMTDSMKRAISETNRRRKIQDAYNKEHGIIPKTIQKSIRDLITNEVTEDKPVVDAEIMVTTEFVGAIMKLCQERRGVYQGMEYMEETRALLKYTLPLNEIIYDFFDSLKSRSRGSASFSKPER